MHLHITMLGTVTTVPADASLNLHDKGYIP